MQQRVDPTYLYDQISFKFFKFETILNKTFRKTKSSLPSSFSEKKKHSDPWIRKRFSRNNPEKLYQQNGLKKPIKKLISHRIFSMND